MTLNLAPQPEPLADAKQCRAQQLALQARVCKDHLAVDEDLLWAVLRSVARPRPHRADRLLILSDFIREMAEIHTVSGMGAKARHLTHLASLVSDLASGRPI